MNIENNQMAHRHFVWVRYVTKNGSFPDLGFSVIYKELHKINREKSYTAGSYPM